MQVAGVQFTPLQCLCLQL